MTMSSEQVTVPHPFAPDAAEPLRGVAVATTPRRDSPFPWATVRVPVGDGDDNVRVRVPAETLRPRGDTDNEAGD